MKLLLMVMTVVLIVVPAFAQEWNVVANPDANMRDLHSITVTPNGTVHAVGDNGTYLINSGSGFVLQPPPSPADLKKIVAIDDNIIFIGGSGSVNGMILKTINGGNNWTGTFLENMPLK